MPAWLLQPHSMHSGGAHGRRRWRNFMCASRTQGKTDLHSFILSSANNTECSLPVIRGTGKCIWIRNSGERSEKSINKGIKSFGRRKVMKKSCAVLVVAMTIVVMGLLPLSY